MKLFNFFNKEKILDDELYIFIHVDKCAGTTIRKGIEKHYRKSERLALYEGRKFVEKDKTLQYIQNLKEKQKDKIKVIYGHLAFYGIHELFPKKKVKYFLFLRNPIKRTISHYDYLLNHRPINAQISHKVKDDKKNINTIEKWLDIYSPAQNYMVWFLSQRIDGKVLSQLDYQSNEKDLIKAKELLDKCFFIGLTEKSEEDLAFIYRHLKLNVSPKKKTNVSKKSAEIDEKLKKKISSFNLLDIELYNYAIEKRGQEKLKIK